MDLLKYLEPMKNIPERFSNLAFWRGVRKLKDEVVNAFEYVDSWGTLVENNLTSLESNFTNLAQGVSAASRNAGQAMGLANQALNKMNNAFTSRDVNITSNVSPTIYPYTVTESQVPYPRVENCIMRFDGLSTSGITSNDIIESANFTGSFTVDGVSISFTQPMPLVPVYYTSSISFLSPPISFYKTSSSSMSISNVRFSIKVRCRRIPS